MTATVEAPQEAAWTPAPGKALALRTCRRMPDGTLRSFWNARFVWPSTPGAEVFPERWDPTPMCGGGLHGLLWGEGHIGYLHWGGPDSNPANPFDPPEPVAWQVVEVDEAECVVIDGDKVKFPRCTVVYTGDRDVAVELIAAHAPDWRDRSASVRDLSVWAHYTYSVEFEDPGEEHADYSEDAVEAQKRFAVPLSPLSTVISSELADGSGDHTVAIDIDHAVRVVPSSTEGHFHLYIDVRMPWWRYRRLLKALARAGVIERGYYSAAVRRRGTHLRLPWVKKGGAR